MEKLHRGDKSLKPRLKEEGGFLISGKQKGQDDTKFNYWKIYSTGMWMHARSLSHSRVIMYPIATRYHNWEEEEEEERGKQEVVKAVGVATINLLLLSTKDISPLPPPPLSVFPEFLLSCSRDG